MRGRQIMAGDQEWDRTRVDFSEFAGPYIW